MSLVVLVLGTLPGADPIGDAIRTHKHNRRAFSPCVYHPRRASRSSSLR